MNIISNITFDRSKSNLPHENGLLGLILLTAIIIRLVYLLYFFSYIPYASKPIVDSDLYFQVAKRIASGIGYGPKPYYMSPLYPQVLGWLFTLTGASVKLVILMQSLLGVLNLYLLYALTRRIFGGLAGLIAIVLAMLYAPLMFLETKLLTETLFITVGLAGLNLLYTSVNRKNSGLFFLTGLLWGIDALIRPNILIFVVLFVFWYAWVRRKRLKDHAWLPLVTFVSGVLLAILPVTARNIVIGHDMVLISSNGGIVFAQTNHLHATGIATKLPGFSGRIQTQQKEEMDIVSKAMKKHVKPSESSAYWLKMGIRYILEHPWDYLVLEVKKLLWSIHSQEARHVYNIYYESQRIPLLHMLFLPFWILAGFGLFGFWRSRQHNEFIPVLGLFVLSIYLTLWIFAVSSRYRVPAIPVIAMFAGYGVECLFVALKNRAFKEILTELVFFIPFLLVMLVPYPIPKITAEAPTNMGAAFLRQGRITPAIKAIKQAIKMDPGFEIAHYNLGLAFARIGKVNEAIREFKTAIRLKPFHAQAHHNLALMFDRQGDLINAIKEYKRTIHLAPTQPQPHCNLAIDLYQKERYVQAMKEAKACQRLGLKPAPGLVKAIQIKLEQGK